MTYLKELQKQNMKSSGWPFNHVPSYYWKRDSAIGIAPGYGLDDQGVGVRVPVESRLFSMSSRQALGPTQPPIQWVAGAFPGVKAAGA
jgi:hypothetical protein